MVFSAGCDCISPCLMVLHLFWLFLPLLLLLQQPGRVPSLEMGALGIDSGYLILDGQVVCMGITMQQMKQVPWLAGLLCMGPHHA